MDNLTRYKIDPSQVSAQEFDGEIVAVNFTNGRYYGMRGSAPQLWSIFEVGASINEAAAHMETAFGSLSEVQLASVTRFVSMLVNESLVHLDSEPSGGDLPALAAGVFEEPLIEVHSDLEELIVLDPIHDTDPSAGWPLRRTDS